MLRWVCMPMGMTWFQSGQRTFVSSSMFQHLGFIRWGIIKVDISSPPVNLHMQFPAQKAWNWIRTAQHNQNPPPVVKAVFPYLSPKMDPTRAERQRISPFAQWPVARGSPEKGKWKVTKGAVPNSGYQHRNQRAAAAEAMLSVWRHGWCTSGVSMPILAAVSKLHGAGSGEQRQAGTPQVARKRWRFVVTWC